MSNRIISLSKIFVKEFYQKLPIFNRKTKNVNKKSVFFWMILILTFVIALFSDKSIRYLINAGQPEIFLNIYFFIIFIIILFQSIIVCANLFFFSKDIENILHMPIKDVELLTSKFISMLVMLYITETCFALIPYTMYGIYSSSNILYYFWELIILIAFPIFIASVVSIITFIFMRFAKFIKNKDRLQIINSGVLIVLIVVLEYIFLNVVFPEEQYQNMEIVSNNAIVNNIESVYKYLLIIQPSINMLLNPFSLNALKGFLELALYSSIVFLVFIFLGKRTYLKDLLINMISYNKTLNVTNNIKVGELKNIKKSYINIEFKKLFKNPIFFMQTCLPVIMLTITLCIVAFVLYPIVVDIMKDESFIEIVESFSLNMESIVLILILNQVLFSISNISLTAISREGKNAILVKYIPVSLYKQFVYKNVPQIIFNMCISIVVLGAIWYMFPSISYIYIIEMFAVLVLFNFINSYLMLIVDLIKPNLDWDSEVSVVKKNNNKAFQYVFLIINVLMIMYIGKIIKDLNIIISLGIMFIIYLVVFIIIDRLVKKYQNKLFNKII